MDRIVSHDELRKLLGAYAVHAIDDDEYTMVEGHLADCDECRDEVDRLLEASASLALSTAVTVSGSLWARISSEVAEHPRRLQSSGQTEHHDRSVAPLIVLDAARENRRERRTRVRIALASAAAAAALTAPLTSVFSSSPAPSLAALADRAASQSGSRRITLKGPDGSALVEAVLTSTGKGYVRQDSLPPLGDGRTYQLWAVANGKPVSAGLLGADPDVAAFTVDARIDALAISVEPGQGSVAPSGTPVASGPLI